MPIHFSLGHLHNCVFSECTTVLFKYSIQINLFHRSSYLKNSPATYSSTFLYNLRSNWLKTCIFKVQSLITLSINNTKDSVLIPLACSPFLFSSWLLLSGRFFSKCKFCASIKFQKNIQVCSVPCAFEASIAGSSRLHL